MIKHYFYLITTDNDDKSVNIDAAIEAGRKTSNSYMEKLLKK